MQQPEWIPREFWRVGEKKPISKGYTLWFHYIIFLRWQNYRDGKGISGSSSWGRCERSECGYKGDPCGDENVLSWCINVNVLVEIFYYCLEDVNIEKNFLFCLMGLFLFYFKTLADLWLRHSLSCHSIFEKSPLIEVPVCFYLIAILTVEYSQLQKDRRNSWDNSLTLHLIGKIW